MPKWRRTVGLANSPMALMEEGQLVDFDVDCCHWKTFLTMALLEECDECPQKMRERPLI
jgi:hypothetical protein